MKGIEVLEIYRELIVEELTSKNLNFLYKYELLIIADTISDIIILLYDMDISEMMGTDWDRYDFLNDPF